MIKDKLTRPLEKWAFEFATINDFTFEIMNKNDHFRVRNNKTGKYVDWWLKGSVRTIAGHFFRASRSGAKFYDQGFIKKQIMQLQTENDFIDHLKRFWRGIFA